MVKHFSNERTVLVGINVDHDELCKWAMRSYVDYTPIKHVQRKESKPAYTGGSLMNEAGDKTHGHSHVAIGFETKGWNSSDLVPVTVLQTLLGGGGSFSTGGPGKGMHSRLFLNVLNTHHQVETCMAFNSMNSDSGLFGMYLSGDGKSVPRLIQIAAEEFSKLNKFTPDELERAKNTLKANIFINYENSKMLMEDIGRQLIMTDRANYQSVTDFANLIDKVTEKDLINVAHKLLSTPVTFVVHGDTAFAPHLSAVQNLFENVKSKMIPSSKSS